MTNDIRTPVKVSNEDTEALLKYLTTDPVDAEMLAFLHPDWVALHKEFYNVWFEGLCHSTTAVAEAMHAALKVAEEAYQVDKDPKDDHTLGVMQKAFAQTKDEIHAYEKPIEWLVKHNFVKIGDE